MFIWLPLKFPIAAPIAYVKRDATKFIYNPKCKIIDSSRDGRVTNDYLRNWGYPSSNLVDCIGDLQIAFGEFPPLYGNNSTGTATQSAAQGQTPASTSGHNSSNSSSGLIFNPFGANASSANRPSPPPVQQQQPAPVVVPPPAGVSIWAGALTQQQQQEARLKQQQRQDMLKNQRAAAYHLALTTGLSARLGGALDAAAIADRQHQLTIQAELQSRSVPINNEFTRLQKEREALDAAAHELSASGAALDAWLKVNEPRAQSVRAAVDGDIDPDEAIVPADVLTKQAIAALSADMALEDTLAVLDRSLEGKKVALTEYLSQVRAVSRKQFTARALSTKITNKQLSERTAAVAAVAAAAAQVANKATAAATLYPTVMSPGNGSTAPPPPPPPVSSTQWNGIGSGVLMNPLAAAAKNMRR